MSDSKAEELWVAARAAEAQDPPSARRLFQEAADVGHPGACNKIAELHLAAGDPATAAHWFRRAGVHGSGAAWFSLGRLYGKGQGVEADMGEAHDCMRRAAALGDERARQFVRDALGEDPDATPPPKLAKAPPPPAPRKGPKAQSTGASRRGQVISLLLLGALLVAAGVGSYLVFFQNESKAPAAPTASSAAQAVEAVDPAPADDPAPAARAPDVSADAHPDSGSPDEGGPPGDARAALPDVAAPAVAVSDAAAPAVAAPDAAARPAKTTVRGASRAMATRPAPGGPAPS